MATGSTPWLVRRYQKRFWRRLGGISPSATAVGHSTSPPGQSLTLRWRKSRGRGPQSPCSGGNRRRYGSAMRGGGRKSWSWIKHNRIVTNFPIVTEYTCSVATAWGWNTTTNYIWAFHRAKEAELKNIMKFCCCCVTGSMHRCPLCFHSLICSKNNSYFVVINPLFE